MLLILDRHRLTEALIVTAEPGVDFFDYLQRERCAVMPSYKVHNRRVLHSDALSGIVILLIIGGHKSPLCYVLTRLLSVYSNFIRSFTVTAVTLTAVIVYSQDFELIF